MEFCNVMVGIMVNQVLISMHMVHIQHTKNVVYSCIMYFLIVFIFDELFSIIYWGPELLKMS